LTCDACLAPKFPPGAGGPVIAETLKCEKMSEGKVDSVLPSFGVPAMTAAHSPRQNRDSPRRVKTFSFAHG
jgi:hypothetical protein